MKADLVPLVDELERIQTTDELRTWKGSHELSSELVRALMSRLQALLTVDAQAALRLSEWMISIASELEDPASKALALRGKGIALITADNYFHSI